MLWLMGFRFAMAIGIHLMFTNHILYYSRAYHLITFITHQNYDQHHGHQTRAEDDGALVQFGVGATVLFGSNTCTIAGFTKRPRDDHRVIGQHFIGADHRFDDELICK